MQTSCARKSGDHWGHGSVVRLGRPKVGGFDSHSRRSKKIGGLTAGGSGGSPTPCHGRGALEQGTPMLSGRCD